MLVRSEERGAVAFGARGTHYLDEGRIEGEDPLAPFGPNAAAHVRRTDGFAHCPDLLVNAAFSPDTEEVAAFEELVGSHGGMGGSQSLPVRPLPVRAALSRAARWSAPSTCTTSCAAGWSSSATTPTATKRRSPPLVTEVPHQRRDDRHQVELADEHLEHRERPPAARGGRVVAVAVVVSVVKLK